MNIFDQGEMHGPPKIKPELFTITDQNSFTTFHLVKPDAESLVLRKNWQYGPERSGTKEKKKSFYTVSVLNI